VPHALADFPALATARLTLRPVAEADLPDLLAVNGDDAVTRFLPYATWNGLDDARAWLQRMQALEAAATARQFVLALNDSGTAVGTLLLFKYDAGAQRAEVGYALGRAHQGRGLMAEALRATCTQALGAAGLRRLEAEVDPANAPSNALLQRLGFTREGTLRQRWAGKGRVYDTHIYGLLAGEVRAPD
jgi:RimJ/RimL family protein N-acetyltransferase